MVGAARTQVPLLIGIMAAAFATYLVLKGLNRIWRTGFTEAALIGLIVGALAWRLAVAWVRQRTDGLAATKAGINALFTLPLVCAAALLSFAHGANDVANAVGPLAAIAETLKSGAVSGRAPIPLWVMVVGALGIALGLMLYGPRLIRKVGSEITELDQMRAFCIAMSAAVTVIVASQLGLPVSSTHIAVGGVFGVGFLREWLKRRHAGAIEFIRLRHAGEDRAVVEAFLESFQKASLDGKRAMIKALKERQSSAPISKFERKQLNKQAQRGDEDRGRVAGDGAGDRAAGCAAVLHHLRHGARARLRAASAGVARNRAAAHAEGHPPPEPAAMGQAALDLPMTVEAVLSWDATQTVQHEFVRGEVPRHPRRADAVRRSAAPRPAPRPAC
jgi:hypothetical protein